MKRVLGQTFRLGLRMIALVRLLFPMKRGPRIITYHSVRPDGLGRRSAFVHPNDFDMQLRWLREQGFEVVSLSKLTNAMHLGQAFPTKWVCITFDDGYSDNYVHAFPILKRYNVPATVFLISGMVNRDPAFLTLPQIREMSLQNIEFGAHSVDHVWLSRVEPHLARHQVFQSKSQLEELMGCSVEHFCYPFGDYNTAVEEMVIEAGFRTCCTEQAGPLSINSNPFRLVRVGILGTDTLLDFGLKVRGAYDWWTNAFMRIQKWRDKH